MEENRCLWKLQRNPHIPAAPDLSIILLEKGYLSGFPTMHIHWLKLTGQFGNACCMPDAVLTHENGTGRAEKETQEQRESKENNKSRTSGALCRRRTNRCFRGCVELAYGNCQRRKGAAVYCLFR